MCRLCIFTKLRHLGPRFFTRKSPHAGESFALLGVFCLDEVFNLLSLLVRKSQFLGDPVVMQAVGTTQLDQNLAEPIVLRRGEDFTDLSAGLLCERLKLAAQRPTFILAQIANA